MRHPVLLAALLLMFSILAIAAAGERECMRYVPGVDKLVAVECDELEKTAPPVEHAAPVEAPAAAPAPATGRDLEESANLKEEAVELTEALTSAAGDADFRDAYCTLYAAGYQLRRQKDQSEVQQLQDQHSALEKKVGERGRLVRSALAEPAMSIKLGSPADDATPGTRLRDTPEGQAFLKARDGLRLQCRCLRDKHDQHLVCCDSCDLQALEGKTSGR
jgi:hypothetical protein